MSAELPGFCECPVHDGYKGCRSGTRELIARLRRGDGDARFAHRSARPWPYLWRAPAGEHYIYGLVDWRDDTIRYIGQAGDPHRRLKGHVSSPARTKMEPWLRSFPANRRKPDVEIIARCSKRASGVTEAMWIRAFLGEGFALYNTAKSLACEAYWICEQERQKMSHINSGANAENDAGSADQAPA